jgi:hypothetical protein
MYSTMPVMVSKTNAQVTRKATRERIDCLFFNMPRLQTPEREPLVEVLEVYPDPSVFQLGRRVHRRAEENLAAQTDSAFRRPYASLSGVVVGW